MFLGSQQAGPGAAVLFTILAGSKRHGIEPWTYLRELLLRLHDDEPARGMFWKQPSFAKLERNVWRSTTGHNLAFLVYRARSTPHAKANQRSTIQEELTS